MTAYQLAVLAQAPCSSTMVGLGPPLGWVRPFSGANPGNQLVAVLTEVPGFGSRTCALVGWRKPVKDL